jgi:hypothetical protein
MIGYVRKSPGSEAREQRLKLLQNMIKRLNKGTLVDKTFASYICTSNQLFENRDKSGKKKKVSGAVGNTQGNITIVEKKIDLYIHSICYYRHAPIF